MKINYHIDPIALIFASNYCITLSTHTHDLEGKNYMGKHGTRGLCSFQSCIALLVYLKLSVRVTLLLMCAFIND